MKTLILAAALLQPAAAPNAPPLYSFADVYRLTVNGTVLTYTTDNEPFGDVAASQHLAQPSHHVALARDADLLPYQRANGKHDGAGNEVTGRSQHVRRNVPDRHAHGQISRAPKHIERGKRQYYAETMFLLDWAH